MQRDRDPRGVSKGLAGGTVKTGVGDLPGMDRIDPDAPLRELQDRSLSQTAQPPFARRVGGIVMRGQTRGRGGNSDKTAGAQCFMPSIGPVRLAASVRFHASTVVSAIPWRAIVPALLTSTWSLPKRPNAAAATSFQEPSSATSWRRNRTLPPSPAT